MHDLNKILDIAVEIAREAGEVLREGWGNASRIDYKGEVDLITEFDTRAEELIVAALHRAFPDHAIYAEEQGAVEAGNHESPLRWMIDPLDGTTNFAHGFPPFAVSLALTHHAHKEVPYGQPLIGVVYDPTRDECFAAIRGQGATLNGHSIRASNTPSLDTALLATGFAYDRRTRPDNNTGHFSQFIRRCQGIRRAGCAALDLAYVACGRLDGFWELRLHSWDIVAGVLLVQQAGGLVTDLSGGPNFLSGEQIVASNSLIHDEMLAVLELGDVAA